MVLIRRGNQDTHMEDREDTGKKQPPVRQGEASGETITTNTLIADFQLKNCEKMNLTVQAPKAWQSQQMNTGNKECKGRWGLHDGLETAHDSEIVRVFVQSKFASVLYKPKIKFIYLPNVYIGTANNDTYPRIKWEYI